MIAHPAHLVGYVTDHWSGDEETGYQHEVDDGNEDGDTCQKPEEA